MKKQIIGLGGGGFSGEANPLLDLYILASSGKKNPKICFLGTASADNTGYIQQFMETFEKYPCEPSYLEIFSPRKPNLVKRILDQDIIYVGGGNTKSMLALWKEWGVSDALFQAYEQGTMLCGVSAGLVCWFKEFLGDSIPKRLSALPALGILPFSACPHYSGGERSRQETFSEFIKSGKLGSGYGVDDRAGVHFENGELVRAVSSCSEAFAYYVSLHKETKEAVMVQLEMVDLSNKKNQKEFILDPFEKFAEEEAVGEKEEK